YMVPKVGYYSYTEDTGVEVSRIGQDQVELAGRADSPGEPTRRASRLAGRADSRDGRTRRRTQPRDAWWLSSPGECNHTTVQLAGELTGVMVELAGELTGVMVELAGELTRMTVQPSGEWLLCGKRSFIHFRSFFQ
ncbi:hypothetical protein HID58_047951, partial [Brassica napus]